MRLLYTGKVQGVGFRYFTKKTAKKYNIKGYVRNLKDGRVELVVNDSYGDIDEFLREIQRGNGFMDIKETKIEEKACNANSFEIAY